MYREREIVYTYMYMYMYMYINLMLLCYTILLCSARSQKSEAALLNPSLITYQYQQ